jgi:hypothetical protein
MVRINKPIRPFCSAKTYSTFERFFDLAAFARRNASGIARPFGLRLNRLGHGLERVGSVVRPMR